jgi:hypothetical protein
MRKLLISLFAAVFLFSAVGCSDKSNSDGENKSKTSEDNTDEQVLSEQTDKHPSELAYEFIKENMKLELDKRAVTGLLGTNFNEIKSEDEVSWRYNVGADTYVSEELNLVTEADYEAIKNGKINVILFINWNEDSVESYTIYYFDRDLNTINEYVVSPNGATATQVTN